MQTEKNKQTNKQKTKQTNKQKRFLKASNDMSNNEKSSPECAFFISGIAQSLGKSYF